MQKYLCRGDSRIARFHSHSRRCHLTGKQKILQKPKAQTEQDEQNRAEQRCRTPDFKKCGFFALVLFSCDIFLPVPDGKDGGDGGNDPQHHSRDLIGVPAEHTDDIHNRVLLILYFYQYTTKLPANQ